MSKAISRRLHHDAAIKGMKRVRHQLKTADRAQSYFWHQPIIELVSEVLETTIGRPIPLAIGALASWSSSLCLLYRARVNSGSFDVELVFIIFIVGFTFGLLVEFLQRASRHPR